ncbi:MAG: methyltransferase [Devosia sp.]|uniref:tRNA1(Val) (adenine(37)-N6)-methyltransferase n=1 Tax=unclassified Devosia TaxID=196773 RepID=UPI001A0442D2|nr:MULTISPECIES: methyltransferase [unclassified Devosia]MBF0681036.1 methyltransferase [Devosia sp.]WEJ32483.1 methyltransferase [Devosia sp. SD17-2]
MSQPSHGFRAGLDSVLLGAAIGRDTRNLLDLGAGVGTASLVSLSLGLTGTATMVERHDDTAHLARRNIDENGLACRANVLGVDILEKPALRREAGLLDNYYDAIIANPPFFGAGQGTLAPNDSRADARHMPADKLETWLRCAAGAAKAGGEIIFIYPAAGLAALLAAFTPRFGAITILPLTPRPNQPASRILVRGIKGSRAPLTLLASRPLHGAEDRAFAPAFDAIFRGAGVLDW